MDNLGMVDNISDELKIYELSLIWKEAEYNFAFWEHLTDLDWNKAYKEALIAVLKTKNIYQYYLELMRFVALLKDGHTGVWFPSSIENSDIYTSKLPIETKLIDGHRVIVNVKKSIANKVKRWSTVKKINGIEINEYINKNIYPFIWHEKEDSVDYMVDKFLREGPINSTVELELEYNSQREKIILTRAKGDTSWQYQDCSLTPNEELQKVYESNSHQIFMTDDAIAVITIDTMMNDDLPKEFYNNYMLLKKAKGYIIDIRKNGGGSSNNSDAIASMFIGGEFFNQRALHPIHIGVYKAWAKWQPFSDMTYEEAITLYGKSDWLEKSYKIPRHLYYEESLTKVNTTDCPGVLKGPLVVLTSANTASAAEDLLIELIDAKRVTIVGSASFGSTGQPLSVNLASGGGFRICTRHNTYIDGREFINIGVKPHVTSAMTINDYINGFDRVLVKGLLTVRGLINTIKR